MNCTRIGLLSFALAATLAPAATLADVIEIPAARDGTLYEDSSGQTANGAGQYVFAGRIISGFAATRRAVLWFDTSAIPSGAQITDVSLRLHMSKTGAAATPVSLHVVTKAWGEGASAAFGGEGGGTTAANGDATWLNTFYPSSAWTTPGGDFVTTPVATTSVGGVAFYQWPSTGAMVSAVNSWIANPGTNFGLLVRGDESADGTTKRFDSRENTVAANRPALVITYTVPSVCAADFNNDGFLDFTDFDAFVVSFEAGETSSDFNGDGFLDFTDFDAFVGAFEAGC